MIEHVWNVFFQIKITSAFVKSFPSDRCFSSFFPSEPTENKKGFNAGMGDWIWIASKTWGFPFLGLRPLGELMWVACGFAKVWGRFFRWMTVRNPQKTGGFHFRVAWFRDFILKFVQIRKVEKFWTISSRHHRWQLFLVWVKKKSKLSGFAFKCILASCMFFHIIHGSWFVILFFSLGVSHSWPSWLPPSKLPHQK